MLKYIISFLAGLFSFLHDRSVAQGAKAEQVIADKQKEIDDAKTHDEVERKVISINDAAVRDKLRPWSSD